MSDFKLKMKMRREEGIDDDRISLKSPKSPKDWNLVKRERETDVKSSTVLKVKKDHDFVVRKETGFAKKEFSSAEKSVKLKTESNTLGSIRREMDSMKHKAMSGSNIGKVKFVKKEGSVSSGKIVSGKGTVAAKKKKKAKEAAEKKGKKVYDLLGQKHDPPEERDPLRIFYESLYEQNPQSEMAEVWMMEHGLLPRDVLKKAFDRKQKRQQNQKIGTPIKLSRESNLKIEKRSSANGDSRVPVKSMRKPNYFDDDDDDDFILKPKKKFKMNP